MHDVLLDRAAASSGGLTAEGEGKPEQRKNVGLSRKKMLPARWSPGSGFHLDLISAASRTRPTQHLTPVSRPIAAIDIERAASSRCREVR